MPLHLLGKKSWNVYNAENIARVKRDEAAAAAREADLEQRLQDEDAATRIALLRGEKPPSPPPVTAEPEDASTGRRRQLEEDQRRRDRDSRRRQRKRDGEDDTDRDIRVAREDRQEREGAREQSLKNDRKDDAPIFDHQGHISLFPDQRNVKSLESPSKTDDPKKSRREQDDGGIGMRFSDAAGRGGSKKTPWYTSAGSGDQSHRSTKYQSSTEGPLMVWGGPSKDVWGNEDPSRKSRDQARTATNDPLAFMRQAQTQLKKVDEERKRWTEEREREVGGFDRDERRHHRSRRDDHRRDSHRRHRRKSPSRSRERHHHRRDRSTDERRRHRSSRRSRSRSPG